MSLTSTAIRYARLVTEPVAVILSMSGKVLFSIMSPTLRAQRNLTWLKKGNGVPASTLTVQFSGDTANVQNAQTACGYATLDDWFDGPDTEVSEEVIGLGEYGRTLTVLRAESLLPSQRFFQKSRY